MDKKLIIFDLDGTLYEFEGGSFRNSNLSKKVLENALCYIQEKLNKNHAGAQEILMKIREKHGEEISIALEKEYGLDRYDYFKNVWNIPSKGYIKKKSGLKSLLFKLKEKFILTLVTDSPAVWANHVLEELEVKDIFGDNIFTGEGDERKGLNNAFERIYRKYGVKPENCIIVGDQEHTDIIPAKKEGITTVFVNQETSKFADYNIGDILELGKIKDDLNKK